MRCEKRKVKFPLGISKRSLFASTKSTFRLSHQNRYQIAVKLKKIAGSLYGRVKLSLKAGTSAANLPLSQVSETCPFV